MVSVYDQLHTHCDELATNSVVLKLFIAWLYMEKCLAIYIPDT